MKTILAFLVSVVFFLTIGCNGGTEDKSPSQKTKTPKGMMIIDLSTYGINATILTPDTNTGVLDIEELSSGEVEIRVGKNYQVSVAIGGDIELKKADLSSDLLFTTTFITDEPNTLFYKSDLPDGSKSYYHFYAIIEAGGISYEVKDLENGDDIPQKAVERMLECAKSLKAKAKV